MTTDNELSRAQAEAQEAVDSAAVSALMQLQHEAKHAPTEREREAARRSLQDRGLPLEPGEV